MLTGQIMEIIYRYHVNEQICMAVFHYKTNQEYTGVDEIDVTNEMLGKVSTVSTNTLLNNMASCQSSDVSYLDVSCQIVFPTRFLKFAAPITKAGSVGVSCTAQNVAAVITKQTRNAGRNAVGSLHIGGLATSLYSGGLATVTLKTSMAFVLSSMLSNIDLATSTTTWLPCLANRTVIVVEGKKHYPIVGSTELYTGKIQPELRVMRRRTVGLGI